MEFEFTLEQQRLREEIREFFRTTPFGELEDPPAVRAFSPSLHRKVVERGWIGLIWPKEYGGQGLSAVEEAIFNEEAGYSGAPLSLANTTGSVTFMGTFIWEYGTEQQKKYYLPGFARGEIWGSQCFTESEARSDLSVIETRAVRRGDYYILNGQKMFTSSGHIVNHVPRVTMLVMAKTEPDAPPREGISLFLVDRDTPGITNDRLTTMGVINTNMVYLDDVRIPKENLLGEENRGWEYFTDTKYVYWDRLHGYYQGIALKVLEVLIQYTKEADRGSLSKDPLVQQELSRLASEIEILRLLTYRLVWMRSKGVKDLNAPASVAKYFRDKVLLDFPNIGMDILGHYGQLQAGSKYAPLRGMIDAAYRTNVYYYFAGAGPLLMPTYIATHVLGLPGGYFG